MTPSLGMIRANTDLTRFFKGKEIYEPQPIAKSDLYFKVEIAAKAIGIDAKVHEWEDQENLTSPESYAVLREPTRLVPRTRFETGNIITDLGYFLNFPDYININSFRINHAVFSQKRYEQFQKVLQEQGLGAYSYLQPALFPTPEIIEKFGTFKPTYQ